MRQHIRAGGGTMGDGMLVARLARFGCQTICKMRTSGAYRNLLNYCTRARANGVVTIADACSRPHGCHTEAATAAIVRSSQRPTRVYYMLAFSESPQPRRLPRHSRFVAHGFFCANWQRWCLAAKNTFRSGEASLEARNPFKCEQREQGELCSWRFYKSPACQACRVCLQTHTH